MNHALTREIRLIAALLVLGIGLVAASCSRVLPPKAGTIAKQAERYNGQIVTVSGKVTERINVGLVKCFVLDDGTGTIGVVTKRPLPYLGTTVRTQGRVDTSFKIGRRPLIAVIEPDPPPTPRPKEKLPDRMPG